jgi:hypothetical protein
VADAVGERGERPALVEVRCVDDVPGGAQLVGEGQAPRRESLRVVKEEELGDAPAR